MIGFTFKQLYIFVNTVHHQSLSKAAERCFITQAAASRSLLHLEQALGAPLFDRVGKRLVLNTNGQQLLPLAKRILDEAEAMQDEMHGEGKVHGQLTIGASTTIANFVLPPLMAKFKKNHPHVSIDLIIDNSYTIAKQMASLALDMAFVEGDVAVTPLDCLPWMEDELYIVCNRQHPLASNSSVRRSELANHPWVFREQGSGSRTMFYKAIGGDEHLQCEIELDSTEAVISYVASSQCLGYISKIICKNPLAAGQIVAIKVEGFEVKRQLLQLRHPDKYQTRACRTFLEQINKK